MKKILCFFGLHNWKPGFQFSADYLFSERIKTCKRCGPIIVHQSGDKEAFLKRVQAMEDSFWDQK